MRVTLRDKNLRKEIGEGIHSFPQCDNMKKLIENRYGFVEPKVIISTVVALIMIVVTLFFIFSIGQIQQEFNPVYSGNFPIENPDIDQVCDTDRYGLTGLTVVQVMNDGSTVIIESGNYTYIQTVVLVEHEVIWG